MKLSVYKLISCLSIPILSIGCTYMAINGIYGWGWILFVIVILFDTTFNPEVSPEPNSEVELK